MASIHKSSKIPLALALRGIRLVGARPFTSYSLKFPSPLCSVSLSSVSFRSLPFSTNATEKEAEIVGESTQKADISAKLADLEKKISDVKSSADSSVSDDSESAESPEAEDDYLKEEREKEVKVKEETAAAVPSVTKKNEKKHSFQAETKQILDIMANSLYTDKEVFLREIISNASDALEKVRYVQTTGNKKIIDESLDLSIKIYTDDSKQLLIVEDTGIGMTREELIENLGTIARSGSKNFMKQVQADGSNKAATANIIGQFGVGFYSTFMVGDRVDVYSTSATAIDGETKSYLWSSDGSGEYDLAEIDRQRRGTKIVIHLKAAAKEFASKYSVESIIRKYSNFVGFPIYFNGNRINAIAALWLQSKDDIKEDQYAEFYKYYCQAYDTPFYRLHFSMDSPIDIHALFFFPERHMEKFGMGRSEPGVSIYSRKILIKAKAKEILPEWLRFVKGVVDSEDIPLNISRENLQDSRLIVRLNNVLTKRIIKYLIEESQKSPERYSKFYNEFGNFIKEGIVTDHSNRNEAAKLLRFESSLESNKLFSIDEYISRMDPSQKSVYFLQAPNRTSALSSPYFESFKQKKIEVLFLYQPIDEFVMQQLGEYGGRKIKGVEMSQEDEGTKKDESKEGDTQEEKEFIVWMFHTLEEYVNAVEITNTLVDSPVVIRSQESAAMRRMMKLMESTSGGSDIQRPMQKHKLEVNIKHPLIQTLMSMRKDNIEVAKTVVEQLHDNALINADLMDNPRSMLGRINKLMEVAMKK